MSTSDGLQDGDYVEIGWLDPQPYRQNRLHEIGCICSQPLRSQVHRPENIVYKAADANGRGSS